jgi:AcrR family transcriptional regulator
MSHKIEGARENLLSCGQKALLAGGYDSLNIKELAAQCGMATGTFYQYFHNKDDLVMQIIYESCRVVPEKIRGVSGSDWGLHRKLEYVYDQFRAYQKTYLRMRIGVLRLSGDYEKLRAAVMAEINAAVEELLRDEIRRGNLELNASPATAAYLLTHFLFSAGRDADLDFDEIWTCMTFRNRDARA